MTGKTTFSQWYALPRDSRKGMTSPTAKKQAFACRNHHRVDMTKNVNLRKQTHFWKLLSVPSVP
ncbi:MAG: hypothetical protein V3V99_05450 [candidate division Zixibacteria bacterium]